MQPDDLGNARNGIRFENGKREFPTIVYDKVKGLLQTQAALSLQVSLLGRFHVGHSLVLDKIFLY